MEQVEVKIGACGVYDDRDDREVHRFQGEKLLGRGDPDHEDRITYTLYECPGGYRVLVHLVIRLDERESSVTFWAPVGADNHRVLLTGEEVGHKFPFLPTMTGKVKDLDDEIQASPEKRERVANFGRIMRLVHSTTTS